MLYVLLVLSSFSCAGIMWLIKTQPRAKKLTVLRPDVLKEVKAACVECGLNPEKLTPDTNLMKTGKLAEVIHFAAIRMDKEHPIATLGDVVRLFQR